MLYCSNVVKHVLRWFNYLYLLFLNSILKQVADVNIGFQKSNADASLLYNDLKRLIVSIAKRFIKPSFFNESIIVTSSSMNDIEQVQKALDKVSLDIESSSLLRTEDVDFGDNFLTYAYKNTVSYNELIMLKERCLAFLIRLTRELLNRMPANLKILDYLYILSPQICMTNTHLFRNLPWELAGTII